MSYDLTFARKSAEQTWDEILETLDDDQESRSAPEPDLWERVVARASKLLADLETRLTDEYGEIHHAPTHIQLYLTDTSGEMTVPYGDAGEAAKLTLRTMYLLGAIVEEETGLEGYDPQVGQPLSEAATDLDLGLASFETVARMFRS